MALPIFVKTVYMYKKVTVKTYKEDNFFFHIQPHAQSGNHNKYEVALLRLINNKKKKKA